MSGRPARRGQGSALDQVPLPVDVSAGLTFTGRDRAPRKWSPLTAAGPGSQCGANHIYLFIRTTLERWLITFSSWTDPLANERRIGTDRPPDHDGESRGGGINRVNGRKEAEEEVSGERLSCANRRW